MNPILVRIVSRYAPIFTFPVAVVLGFIGYSIESRISNRKTPYLDKSINEVRQNRILAENAGEIKPEQKSILDRNDPNELKNLKRSS